MSKELDEIMSSESKAEKVNIDTSLGKLPQKERGSLQQIECKTIEEQRRHLPFEKNLIAKTLSLKS